MRQLVPLSHLLPELFRTLFKPRATVRFPFAPVELPSYSRGRLVIDPELCVGCGQCVRDCPAEALELQRTGRDRFRLIHRLDRCAYCGECQHRCRSGAIERAADFPPASANRDCMTQVLVERGG